ncbi:S41A family C-terminal processing peptidase-3 [Pedobacter psychrotolerans]|uniref:Peptidase S41 n=1 Tax=Pedobacter psychrotolerans TaxID=1843235 RepID=A0A4R2HIP3_9SPHI|nr:S41 family peptidase [Pedobacter psychrotolerans]TCO26833.1 S41A family C-terminal processing peptidase-3 [Pedobacter psychrotolerans]GGE56849.1 peptidase S41 [Pedobacter psychrotolerans]
MKNLRYAFLVAGCCIAILSFSFKEDLFLVSKNLDIFASLYKEININYVDDTNAPQLMKTGIDAMLDSLDPYTEYVPESEIEDYKLKYVSTQYGGIGASTVIIDGKLFVNEVSEGYPAYKDEIKAGDQIIKINGIEIKGKERAQISQLLRGPKGTPVDLVFIREGKELTKKIIREKIKQPNVSYSGMVGDGIGYIKLDKFLENSGQEVKDALLNINKQNPKGIILDLRNNGGGILQEAVKIVNLFVNKDQLIVTQKGKNVEKTIAYKTQYPPVSIDLPLVVLVNANSASASEIVAGSLQDLDRAIVVGQRSYGKGLVQQTFNLPYNSMVKVTVAKYYTPSGRCIQKLDYAHKNADGIAERFADSTMLMFQTKAGRNVYSGNGVYPDVVINADKLSPVTINMINKSLFFNYANQYRKNNPKLESAKTFQLSDADYAAFVNTLADKDLTYQSKTERLLSDLRIEAEKENKSAEVKADLENLKYKLTVSKKTDMAVHKSEIKRVLETQIVSRYFYEKGRIEQSFQYDKELMGAKALFGNQPQMLAILKGEGNYKVIGKPMKETASVD